MSDLFAFFDPLIAIPLFFIGGIFGAYVLWHFPTARIGARWVLFVLMLADITPWLFIIGFRGIENATGYTDAFPRWYQSFGTMLMFLGFDVGAALGISLRSRVVVWNAKRHAHLPHGAHRTRP